MNKVDLNICNREDILISTKGVVLEYISPTPWGGFTYLDHVVRYIPKSIDEPSYVYGTRTSDGFVFGKNREPKYDNDVLMIIKFKTSKQNF